MRRTLAEARELVLVIAAATASLELGALGTYLSGSLLSGGFTTLLIGVPLAIRGLCGCSALVVAAVLAFLGGVPLGEYGRVAGGDQAAVSLPEVAGRRELVRLAIPAGARVDDGAAPSLTRPRWRAAGRPRASRSSCSGR